MADAAVGETRLATGATPIETPGVPFHQGFDGEAIHRPARA
jgi:hypothetical protein